MNRAHIFLSQHSPRQAICNCHIWFIYLVYAFYACLCTITAHIIFLMLSRRLPSCCRSCSFFPQTVRAFLHMANNHIYVTFSTSQNAQQATARKLAVPSHTAATCIHCAQGSCCSRQHPGGFSLRGHRLPCPPPRRQRGESGPSYIYTAPFLSPESMASTHDRRRNCFTADAQAMFSSLAVLRHIPPARYAPHSDRGR